MRKKISNKIFTYIFSNNLLSPEVFYQDESACLFTFRVLPQECQQIILRCINIESDITLKELRWPDITGKNSDPKQYSNILQHLKITKSVSSEKFSFNKNFKENIKKIITVGLTPINIEFKKKRKPYQKCLKAGIDSLETFLKEIKNLEGYPIMDKENETYAFLLSRKIIKKEELTKRYKLTNGSITMLLSDKQSQTCELVKTYIGHFYRRDQPQHEERQHDFGLINLLIKLCTFEIGAVFYNLPPEYQNTQYVTCLDFLSKFGIIYIRKYENVPKYYYVTPLIKCLFEDMKYALEAQQNSKFLIVETDFKFYAYTENDLEIKILDFVFEIEYMFPGFIVGYITRKSIREMLKRGVSATQILDYLSMHAHENVEVECKINDITYRIPENVAHQIIIWEEEKRAISITSGLALCLYDFIDFNDFQRHCNEIGKRGGRILWSSEERQIIVVRKVDERIITSISV